MARGKGTQARGSRAVVHSRPHNHGAGHCAGVRISVCEYKCCACVTPSQQKEAGVHSGVCASVKVKRWHDKATFVPCKHNMAPLQLSQAACVCVRSCACMCVCVCVCVRVRMCVCVPRGIKLVPAGREGRGQGEGLRGASTCKHTCTHASRQCSRCSCCRLPLYLFIYVLINNAAQGLTPFNILGGLQESRELLELLLDDPTGAPACPCRAGVLKHLRVCVCAPKTFFTYLSTVNSVFARCQGELRKARCVCWQVIGPRHPSVADLHAKLTCPP